MNAEPITNVCTAIKFTLPFNRISYYITIPYSTSFWGKSINISFANIILYKKIYLYCILSIKKLYDFILFIQIAHYYKKVNNSVFYLCTQNVICLNKAELSFDIIHLTFFKSLK